MKFIIAGILFFILSSSAYSYLDPGSGSMLLYALLGIVATLLYSLKNIYYKIIRWITGKTTLTHTDIGNAKIVFHSEGGKYWNVFFPVINALEKTNIPCAYITPDEKDPALSHTFPHLEIKIFQSELQSILFMNKLQVPLVVSTTPQLDVYMFTRSKYVQHYCHLIHAPTDVLLYKKFAFDFYDSILCSGSHQIEHIRILETHRNTKKKQLFETGCTYYDVLETHKNNIVHTLTPNTRTILFAPTWGKSSAITKYGFDIFATLLDAPQKHTIIFRPHPQLNISQKELITPILNTLSRYPQVEIDTNIDGTSAMSRADILISDISGIIFDFAFLYNKPIILLETDIDSQGYEGDGIIPYKEIWEYNTRQKIARIVTQNELSSLNTTITDLLTNQDKSIHHISKIKKDDIYNFGKAGVVAAKQLLSILESLEA